MKYKLNLEIPSEKGLKELIEADGLEFGERSRARITKEEQNLIVKIEAEDATSLRASANAIIKVLQVYEKSDKI